MLSLIAAAAQESGLVTTIVTVGGGVLVAIVTSIFAPTVKAWASRKFTNSPAPDKAIPTPQSTLAEDLARDQRSRLHNVEVELADFEHKYELLQRKYDRDMEEAQMRIGRLEAEVLRLRNP